VVHCRNYRGGATRIGAETAQKNAENTAPQKSLQFSIYKGAIESGNLVSLSFFPCSVIIRIILYSNGYRIRVSVLWQVLIFGKKR
jgi:hypothetical protein